MLPPPTHTSHIFSCCSWFVSINYTDYHLVQEAYIKNHEIATHTLYHVADPGEPPSACCLRRAHRPAAAPVLSLSPSSPCLRPVSADLFQIVGAKLWLNQTAYVPLEKIRVRAPGCLLTDSRRFGGRRCCPPWTAQHSLTTASIRRSLASCRASAPPSSSTPPSSAPSCSRMASPTTPPSPSPTRRPAPPMSSTACGPTPWTTACPRTAPAAQVWGGDGGDGRWHTSSGLECNRLDSRMSPPTGVGCLLPPRRPLLRQRDARRAVGVPHVGRAGCGRHRADQHGPPGWSGGTRDACSCCTWTAHCVQRRANLLLLCRAICLRRTSASLIATTTAGASRICLDHERLSRAGGERGGGQVVSTHTPTMW